MRCVVIKRYINSEFIADAMIKRTIFLFALVGLIVAFFAISGSGAINGVQITAEQPVFVQLTGYSMYPTIKDGEMNPCEMENSYCIGDVVAFQCKNQIVSHRIVGELFGKYVTKGDNNIMPDLGLVDSSEILCRVEINQTTL